MPKVSEKQTGRAGKPDTRLALIEAGAAIIAEKGFNNTGLDEILKAVGVPKGSFYYYFSSKSDFGLSIINHHAELYRQKLDLYFDDSALTPVNRLRRYFQDRRDDMLNNACRKGCLFGNLGQEMADQQEEFRARLAEVFQDWSRRLAVCIREAQAVGEIPGHFDPDRLAEFCLCSWEGAVLRAKVTKSPQPMETFITYLFDELFLCRPETRG
jgi:TetR/AcrR family transcriptional repressor of nem operon